MKNKGFTLIELLAVIVILAIIALIATPIILNIINDSKEESKKRSAENYFDAVELAVANKNTKGKFNPDTCKMTGNIGECTGEFDAVHCGGDVCTSPELKVKIDGEIPNHGIIYFSDGSIMEDSFLEFKDYVTTLNSDKKIVLSTPNYVDEVGIRISLPSNLIPVVYKDGNWEIASLKNKWYDYNNQEWANAVILNDGVSNVVGTKIYPSGTNTNIKAMFVYIPRFSYTIGNTYGIQLNGGEIPSQATPGAIDIKFVDTNVKENGLAKYIGNTPSEWYTHPAFDLGGQQLRGIWVGKFELSHTQKYTNYSDNVLGCTDEHCIEGKFLKILPNRRSLLVNNVSNLYYVIKSMEDEKNGFGLSDVDIHMIKNSEWGAVAYLSQSKYGKYGNSNYSGVNKEIYQNKSTHYSTNQKNITGGSNGIPSDSLYRISSGTYPTNGFYRDKTTQCTYDVFTNNCGIGASTTGNITGIYDMSGGQTEYVMGYLETASTTWGSSTSGNQAGFIEKPEEKYFDSYIEFGKDDKGHALSEISTSTTGSTSWYQDKSEFIRNDYPWLTRSGFWQDSSGAGIFYFKYASGDHLGYATSRPVLVSN